MRFNNQYKNLIECFNEIISSKTSGSFCLKPLDTNCPDLDCDVCEYFANTETFKTNNERIKFVIDILNKNLTYPRGCGTCITHPCKHTCTNYLIEKYKIEI